MKLEPIFVVAPDPTLPSMSSRRAFLGMGVAFALGGAVGSACGYSVGLAAAAKDGGAAQGGEDFPPTDDPDLDEFRRLAVKAPIEELMASSLQLLQGVSLTYRTDRFLWRGVDRICAHLVEKKDPKDRLVARLITQIIAQAEQPYASDFAHWSPKLLEIK